MKLSTQQIGRCGELLVQHKLLLHGVESAPMTTDSGIDLVAFSSQTCRALTIQVKTSHKPKPSGGKGKPTLDWWMPEDSPAEIFAFVELEKNQVWLLKRDEMPALAQQISRGRYHLCMIPEKPQHKRKDGKAIYVDEFSQFYLENRMYELF